MTKRQEPPVTHVAAPSGTEDRRKRRGAGFWITTGLAALGTLVVLVSIAVIADGNEDEGALGAIGGFTFLLVTGFTACALRWGPSGVLVPLGIMLLLSGLVGLFGFTIAEDVERTYHEGDNDGDGRIDEDGLGDADGSASDPAKVSGPDEALNHDDDDADGSVDEDPAPLTVSEPEARAVFLLGRQASLATMAVSLVVLGLFFAIQNMEAKRGIGR